MTQRRPEDFLQDMVNYAEDAISFVADIDFATLSKTSALAMPLSEPLK